MDKKVIEKLVRSKDPVNIEIAMNLLVGKSKEEIRRMFGLIHNNSHTLLHGIGLAHFSVRRSYKVSEDCIIYIGYNMSIASKESRNHKDLTINE